MATSSPAQGQSSVQTYRLMPILGIVGRMPPSLCPAMGEWVKEHRDYPQWFGENAAIAFLLPTDRLGTIWC